MAMLNLKIWRSSKRGNVEITLKITAQLESDFIIGHNFLFLKYDTP